MSQGGSSYAVTWPCQNPTKARREPWVRALAHCHTTAWQFDAQTQKSADLKRSVCADYAHVSTTPRDAYTAVAQLLPSLDGMRDVTSHMGRFGSHLFQEVSSCLFGICNVLQGICRRVLRRNAPYIQLPHIDTHDSRAERWMAGKKGVEPQ